MDAPTAWIVSVWVRRAATTAAMLGVVEEAVLAVGGTLDAFMPPNWYEQHIKPFLMTFESACSEAAALIERPGAVVAPKAGYAAPERRPLPGQRRLMYFSPGSIWTGP